jgi:hypothetical protein
MKKIDTFFNPYHLAFKPHMQPLTDTVIFVLNDHASTHVGQGVPYRL